jgi:ABC-2 type transport system ATP-binding protein
MLQGRPDVESATIENGHLIVKLRGAAKAAPIVAALVGAGVQIEEVRRGQASLEDVFLSLMQEGEER